MVELRFTGWAIARIAAQDDWLRQRNPAAANRVMAEIELGCRLIAEQPGLGKRVADTPLRVHVTRRYRYRLIYLPTDTTVEIREILHPRQKQPQVR